MKAYESGTVHSVKFKNPAQNFYILKMKLDSTNQLVDVKGNVSGIDVQVGTWFGFEGFWKTDPKWGRQFTIKNAPCVKGEWTADTAEKALVSYGVGAWTLAQLRKTLSDEEFLNSLGDVCFLQTQCGLTDVSAQHINVKWLFVKNFFQTLGFLNGLGLSSEKIRLIWRTFGDDCASKIRKNPWSLLKVRGVKFEQCDTIAQKYGVKLHGNTDRIRGSIHYVVREGGGFGHLYIGSAYLAQQVRGLCGTSVTDGEIGALLKELHKEKRLAIDRIGNLVSIYDLWNYKIENSASQTLVKRLTDAQLSATSRLEIARSLNPQNQEVWGDLESALDMYLDRYKASLTLTDKQLEGVRNAVLAPVSVITGLPGTGKTTSLKMLVSLLRDAGQQVLLIAPTGIAAKRIASVCGCSASTVHRAFSAKNLNMGGERESTYAGITGDTDGGLNTDGSKEEWGYTPTDPHPADVVVIDESSMLDQHLLYRITRSTKPGCRLVFVGDVNQLHSVGAGNVLKEIISCGVYPVVSLEEIFRQENTSDIVYASHAIHKGVMPDYSNYSDFLLDECHTGKDVQGKVVEIATKLYRDRVNFQVLSPRHKGDAGVTSLNSAIRERINPANAGLREWRIGNDTLREQDRVMVVKNNYKLGVYNGDVGKVNQIDTKSYEIEIKLHDTPARYVRIKFSEAASLLRLAYAMTIHKSQGQEYDVVVIPMISAFHNQLQRNLLYTAVTRAKKKVILLSNEGALQKAVLNSQDEHRNTHLSARIKSHLLWAEAQNIQKERKGDYLYIMQSSGNGHLKIGRAKDPKARVAQLQTGNSEEIKLIASYEGWGWRELDLHTLLAPYRLKGEWFSLQGIDSLPDDVYGELSLEDIEGENSWWKK